MGAQWPPITPPALCHAHMAVESHTPRGGAPFGLLRPQCGVGARQASETHPCGAKVPCARLARTMGAQWPPITPPALCHAHMAVESHVCLALFLTDLHKRGSSDGLTDPCQ